MDQECIQGGHLAYNSQEIILVDPAYIDMFLAASVDETYKQVLTEVKKGSERNELKNLPRTHPAVAFKYCWDLISIQSGPGGQQLLLMDGNRVVVPAKSRKQILCQLHLPIKVPPKHAS
jgi:hypothetical protein